MEAMMSSLFTPLKKEGLTTLKIQYDFRTDQARYYAAKEWAPDLDFSNYNKTFYAESLLTEDARYLNSGEVLALYKKERLDGYLAQVVDLLRQGKHFGMECYYHDKYNIRFMCNQHSRKLGLNNLYHATLAGGIRRHGFEDEELDVIIDGLNLGRAMSFKNIAAGINFGGCKTTVHMAPLDLENLDLMGFLAFAIDRCRTMTGPDMNFPTEMADVMNKHFSAQYTGGPSSPIGETGKPTAYGIYITLKEALKFLGQDGSLKGKTVALQGLGAVGWYMAGHLLDEDVKLFVTARSEDSVKKLMAAYPDKDITPVRPDEILKVDAEIFCPCAIGGIITEENIPDLKFKIIWGPANNQLRASSQEEEIRLAKLLAERGILFQAEWWHNAAGVICGAEHYLYGEAARLENVNKKSDAILPKNTRENLTQAKALGVTPTERVYSICQKLIYGD
jgi:glutamate dehydrogenase/leucine dehydrogenase